MLLDSSQLAINNVISYKIIFENIETRSTSGEMILFLIDEFMYHIYYINDIDYNEENKSAFFENIQLSDEAGLNQLSGKGRPSLFGELFGKIITLALMIFLFLKLCKTIFKKKKEMNNKFGH